MKWKGIHILIFLAAFLAVMPACSSDDSKSGLQAEESERQPSAVESAQEEAVQAPTEPVTLTMYYNGYSESLVADQLEALKEAYPHITLDIISGTPIEEVITSRTPLDMTAYSMGGIFTVMDLHLASDLTELVAKHDFDLNRLSPGVLESAKSYSPEGQLLIMPYELNNSVLTYNLDIFDRFGVDYPIDGMNWDDVYDLAAQTTRFEDGVQYYGFSYSGLNPVYKNQMGLQFIDPETNQAMIDSDEWAHWMRVMTRFQDIEGNEDLGYAGRIEAFFQTKTLAMRTGPSPLDQLPAAVESGLRWDAVTFPKFPGYEELGSQMNSPFYTIVPTSSHKDEAFQVIAFLLSDQIQGMNARKGRVPVVSSPQVVAEFGKDLPFLEGTNYANAVFQEKIAPPAPVSPYDDYARRQLSWAMTLVNVEGMDINTALRQVKEDADSQIEAAIKDGK